MLGSDLMLAFSELNPIGWDRNEIDIGDPRQVDSKIKNLSPNIIINAAGYTAVDKAEDETELANKANGEAVGYLAKIAKEICAPLVHYSTDYVFAGDNKQGYLENDKPDPIGAYGESKLLGEKRLQEEAEMFYIIRTSWLYGKNGKNFVQTMLGLAQQKDELKVVNDQFGKPTYAKDLAWATKKLIAEQYPCGIYHLSNEGQASWHQFAKKIFQLAGINVKLTAIKTSDYPTKAVRPKYSSLINTKFPPLRHWQEALTDYLT